MSKKKIAVLAIAGVAGLTAGIVAIVKHKKCCDK